jgi:MarR family transcriptional regulator, organic hydroperoxide resistance regulator
MYKQGHYAMNDSQKLLHHCLYFTANSLARTITRMAETEFRSTGLSPAHAFLMMLVNECPGIGQKELSEALQLAPSTVTRFIDTMVYKGYLERRSEGKMSLVFPTDQGGKLQQPILQAWKGLHDRYAAVLGLESGDRLAAMIDNASERLNKK